MKQFTWILGAALIVTASAGHAQSVNDINSFQDNERLFNDFSTTTLAYASSYPTLSITESGYTDDGMGGNFANRHAAWLSADSGASKFGFEYGTKFALETTLQVASATGVGAVEAGIQLDLFGLGFFGVTTSNGAIFAGGSAAQPGHFFGESLYNIGDVITLRMIHNPGNSDGAAVLPGTPGIVASTMTYEFENITQGTSMSSGAIEFANTELGIPSAAGGVPGQFPAFLGIGAQINQPTDLGAVSINFTNTFIEVPAPGASILAVGGLAGLASRRRR